MSRIKIVLLGTFALLGVAANGPQGCGAALQPPAPVSSVLDPTSTYEDRLRLFHLLKEAHPYPSGWADHRDGIAVQAQWQMKSERDVADGSGQLFSWWPNVNWTLVVWPFLILQQYRGEFADQQVLEFQGWKKGRFWIPPSIVKSVLAYYDQLDSVRKASQAGSISAWEKSWFQWTLQKLLWDFHHEAISVGMARNRDLLPGLEKPGPDRGERMFAESWGTMVGILKALNFPTSVEVVGLFNHQILPGSWVKETDYNLWKSSSLSYSQRLTLKALWSIHRFEQKWGNEILKLIRSLASTPEKAEKVVDVIRKTVNNGSSGFSLWKALWSL